MWGVAGSSHYASWKDTNWLLWKQPTVREVLALLDKRHLKNSVENFSVHRALTVGVNNVGGSLVCLN